MGRLELALALSEKVAPIEKALAKARRSGSISGKTIHELAVEGHKKGIISEEDVALLDEMEDLRLQVIQVDSFDNIGNGGRKKPATKKRSKTSKK